MPAVALRPDLVRGVVAEDYPELWRWSVTDPDAFWLEVAEGIDLTGRRVHLDGTEVDLTPREFDLLAHLAEESEALDALSEEDDTGFLADPERALRHLHERAVADHRRT